MVPCGAEFLDSVAMSHIKMKPNNIFWTNGLLKFKSLWQCHTFKTIPNNIFQQDIARLHTAFQTILTIASHQRLCTNCVQLYKIFSIFFLIFFKIFCFSHWLVIFVNFIKHLFSLLHRFMYYYNFSNGSIFFIFCPLQQLLVFCIYVFTILSLFYTFSFKKSTFFYFIVLFIHHQCFINF